MNKNLKKVISTIAALAISASSFVALAATSTFPDVEDTAAYSTAVKELVGLGIVNGYEDGTFGPDQLVTRAEITKMIVLVLGMGSSADAAYGSDTQFSDVSGSHWASGYITVGVTQGFINGMGDGTFDPDANVQFLQAEKMLVGACGYTTWAENAGGWPSGYSSYASQLSLASNVEGSPSNTTELNRGQVAQLISNALDAPACVQNGFTTDAWGNSIPNLEQKDGTGDGYQTLLIQKHDAYKVYGRVTANSRSTGGSLDEDEVRFDVERADNFDGEYYRTGDDPETITAYTGNSGAEDCLFEYAQAIIQNDDNDDWNIIVITSTAKNDIVTVDADMFDEGNSGYTDGAYYDYLMYFYTDSNKKKTASYKLSGYSSSDDDDVVYYVNGVEDAITSADDFETYITNNNCGTITLIDAPASGSTSTDGRYDYVMVTYYADALVDSVTESSTPKVVFDTYDTSCMKSSLTVDPDDDDVTYTFELDGEEIDVTDIAEDDVLSIAFDVTVSFDDSSFYEVIVSRDVVSGKVTGVDGVDGYQISGTYYEPNTNLLDELVDDDGEYVSGDITSGTEYTLYLNAFGKFVSYDEGEGSVKNYVVLETVYQSNGDDWYITYFDQTGTKTSTEIRKTGDNIIEVAAAVYDYDLTDADYEDDVDDVVEKIKDYGKRDYQDRVAEVSINTSDQLTLKSIKSYTVGDGEYKLKTYKIGSVKMSDSTVILNFSDYEDDGSVSLMSLSSFVDESDYYVYGYSKSSSDSSYRFVLVDNGGGEISGTSQMAIYLSNGTTTNSDDEDAYQIKAYVGGETTYLVLSTDLDDSDISAASLVAGAPFFYTTDSDGYIDELIPVLGSDAADNLSYEDDFKEAVFEAAEADANGSFDSNLDSYFYDGTESVNFGTSSSEAYIHFGPVVDKSTNSVTIAELNATYDGEVSTYADALDDYTYASSVTAYVYDYDYSKTTDRVDVGAKGSVVKTTLTKDNYFDSDKDYIDWSVTDPEYVLVKEYDDDVTELLVITNSGR